MMKKGYFIQIINENLLSILNFILKDIYNTFYTLYMRLGNPINRASFDQRT